MKAFLTGSRAYGTPQPSSDIDLVVFLSRDDLAVLRQFDEGPDPRHTTNTGSEPDKPFEDGVGAPLRFGKLNLLCITDPKAYACWLNGTATLKKMAPVSRDFAVEFFRKLREEAGLTGTKKQVGAPGWPIPKKDL